MVGQHCIIKSKKCKKLFEWIQVTLGTKWKIHQNEMTVTNHLHTGIPKTNDIGQPKSTVNLETWVANLTPTQQSLLLSTLLKHTESIAWN